MTQPYSAVTKEDLSAFQSICGSGNVFTSTDKLVDYGHDETEDLEYLPEVIVLPSGPEEIAALFSYCNSKRIPVTPRGAGTGLSGGALPVYGGLLISMERFNKIIQIDERNLQATVEPGVITQVFQDAVKEKGLFYPPDPASRGSCFIGGNISENSGGPKAVKYGVTKDYVLNLEIVLPTGEIMWTGANVLKNSTGYNLTQLMIGSEGTLGIITKIVFRLIPHPKYNVVMLIPFRDPAKACEAVSAVFREGITPSGMEFMERDAINFTLKYAGGISMQIPGHVKAHLLVELDGNHMEQLMSEAEQIAGIMEKFECDEVMFADTEEQKANLWKLRRKVGEAVKSHSVYKEEDTVVPRAELPRLLSGVKSIGNKYGFNSVCYGHAGDGNLHVNIIKGDLSDRDWNEKIPLGIMEIFKLCVELGGTISGEHGIGLVQKDYMHIPFTPKGIDLQKEIKKVFDPNGILNPGKMFP